MELLEFTQKIKKLFEVNDNEQENIYLKELRDALLPDLMSGKLKVK